MLDVRITLIDESLWKPVRAEENDRPRPPLRRNAVPRAPHGGRHRVEVERMVGIVFDVRDVEPRAPPRGTRESPVELVARRAGGRLRPVREQRERDDPADVGSRNRGERIFRGRPRVAHRDEHSVVVAPARAGVQAILEGAGLVARRVV